MSGEKGGKKEKIPPHFFLAEIEENFRVSFRDVSANRLEMRKRGICQKVKKGGEKRSFYF